MIEKKIIVLSDIHSNFSAYKQSLLVAEKLGFDQLINLGDLLTYGCDTNNILELTSKMISKYDMKLIKGNHDQLYFDLIKKDYSYYNKLPDWIKESIDWIMDKKSLHNFYYDYDWLDFLKTESFYFAHANPFDYGNWDYLINEAKYIESAIALNKKKCRFGIFGHTHRKNVNTISYNLVCKSMINRKFFSKDFIKDKLAININVDSIGQPRSKSKRSSLLILDIKKNGVELEFKNFFYDVESHLNKIKDSSLSNNTKNKLISFF